MDFVFKCSWNRCSNACITQVRIDWLYNSFNIHLVFFYQQVYYICGTVVLCFHNILLQNNTHFISNKLVLFKNKSDYICILRLSHASLGLKGKV